MIRAIQAAILSVVMGVAPRMLYAEEPTEVDVDVVVSTEDGMLMGDDHRDWVEMKASRVLDELPPLSDGDHIVVEVGGVVGQYKLAVTPYHDGQPVVELRDPFDCPCTTEELLNKVAEQVEVAVEELAKLAEAERDAAALEERQRERREAAAAWRRQQEADRARREMLSARRYRPKTLGWGGILASGLGGGLLVGGIVLTARAHGPATGSDMLDAADLRPGGYALMGIGGAVLATGLGLLIVDYVRCQKDRVKCGQRGATPTASWKHGSPWASSSRGR